MHRSSGRLNRTSLRGRVCGPKRKQGWGATSASALWPDLPSCWAGECGLVGTSPRPRCTFTPLSAPRHQPHHAPHHPLRPTSPGAHPRLAQRTRCSTVQRTVLAAVALSVPRPHPCPDPEDHQPCQRVQVSSCWESASPPWRYTSGSRSGPAVAAGARPVPLPAHPPLWDTEEENSFPDWAWSST